MTRSEFIQRAAIQMSGKVIGTNAMFDNGEEEKIAECACDLADKVEEYAAFDDEDDFEELCGESMKSLIWRIVKAIEKPDSDVLSVFQEMVMQRNEHIKEIRTELSAISDAIADK